MGKRRTSLRLKRGEGVVAGQVVGLRDLELDPRLITGLQVRTGEDGKLEAVVELLGSVRLTGKAAEQIAKLGQHDWGPEEANQ